MYLRFLTRTKTLFADAERSFILAKAFKYNRTTFRALRLLFAAITLAKQAILVRSFLKAIIY